LHPDAAPADTCSGCVGTLFAGWLTQTLVEPVSLRQFINSGFSGATFNDFLPPTFKTPYSGLIVGAHRLLSGNAHARRRPRAWDARQQIQ